MLLIVFVSCANKDNSIYSWRGDNRDGVYAEENLLKEWPEEGPELVLTIDQLGVGYTSPTVTPEYVYISGMIDSTGYQYCYNHEGELVWKTSIGKEWNEKSFQGPRSVATVKGDALYTLSSNGLAFKMNSLTGEIIWEIDLKEQFGGDIPTFGFCESPLLVDDKVVFTPGDSINNVVCLTQSTGDLVWSSPGEGNEDVSAYCSAKLIDHNGRRILVQMTKYHIQGMDFDSGEKLWSDYSFKEWTDNCNTPIYKDGKLLMITPYKAGARLYQISESGDAIDTIWTNQALDASIQSMVVYEGAIYSASSSKRNYICVDWETGKTLWTSRELKTGPFIFADGMLYAFANDGEAALIQPSQESFKVVSRFKAFKGKQLFTHPVIAQGKLYLRNNDVLKVYNIKSQN